MQEEEEGWDLTNPMAASIPQCRVAGSLSRVEHKGNMIGIDNNTHAVIGIMMEKGRYFFHGGVSRVRKLVSINFEGRLKMGLLVAEEVLGDRCVDLSLYPFFSIYALTPLSIPKTQHLLKVLNCGVLKRKLLFNPLVMQISDTHMLTRASLRAQVVNLSYSINKQWTQTVAHLIVPQKTLFIAIQICIAHYGHPSLLRSMPSVIDLSPRGAPWATYTHTAKKGLDTVSGGSSPVSPEGHIGGTLVGSILLFCEDVSPGNRVRNLILPPPNPPPPSTDFVVKPICSAWTKRYLPALTGVPVEWCTGREVPAYIEDRTWTCIPDPDGLLRSFIISSKFVYGYVAGGRGRMGVAGGDQISCAPDN
nr:hypothetical protein HmN_000585500 [Hymenolepis microstoma]